MAENCKNPTPRIRAAAHVIHSALVQHRWAGPHYQKTYQELEETDPIGFQEFNEVVADALNAADSA